ncbi:hypothetical protein K435DRAFT_850766 [Dendrothele bispora CBS 962.96]|uniref:Protein BIG1 n=1 Tax=Dendrothele bispora (strain CBS 962.96) TaxID=1314807 RepID=A0A4S8MNG0_DENBC|nr:hypothetical protein K435DRAFT_850766 [Dendrothele bispora CBS 962.96]
MSSTMTCLAFLLSLSLLALAFSNTSPFIAWSPYSSDVLGCLPLAITDTHSVQLLEKLLLSDDACKHDAIVLVDQPGLHASDLRNLPSNSHIAQSLSSAPSSHQFAYVPLTLPTTSTDSSLSVVARTASEKCGFQFVTTMPGQGGASFSNEKSIIFVTLPELEPGIERKGKVAEHGEYHPENLDIVF